MQPDQYYKIVPNKIQYKGDRYFRYNIDTQKVVQVCMTCGEVKKGKSNTYGIYLIHRITFFSNYLSYRYVEECSKGEFETKFNEVVNYLK